MSSLLSITKKTLFIGLGVLLLSSTQVEAKPPSSFRGLQQDSVPGCWMETYSRGVGKPISTCPDGSENGSSLCYTPCKDGYTGNGPVCWQNCPDGYTDTGADCLKPSSYGRGAGYAVWDKDQCEQDNPQGCELNGALYYPKCKDGFEAVGCCVCSPKCSDGMSDIGVSCQKKSYDRGTGKPLVCQNGEEEDAGLCYEPCKNGYKGIGPLCWGSCATGMYQCGALCTPNEDSCAGNVLSIAEQVLKAMSDAKAYEDGEELSPQDSGVDLGVLTQNGLCSNM